jgi:hypothetical protein
MQLTKMTKKNLQLYKTNHFINKFVFKYFILVYIFITI